MTDHSPAFAAALDAVSLLLGAPSARRTRTVCYGDEWPAFARWERSDDALEITDEGPTLTATRPDGDVRSWAADAEGVCAACAWLGWPLPRPTLPGLAPRPLDRDGAPRSTTGGPMGEDDW